MQHIDSKKVIKYAVMPGIRPRMRSLLGGFTFFSTLMAQIYAMVGLLPHNHPYLNPENAGRFRIHHVIAEAANNLKLNAQNLDKIFIFFALLAGVVLLFMQFIFLFGILFVQMSWAAIPAITLFDTVNPQQDVAFNIMTRVFGIPGIFCSSSAPSTCAVADALVPFPIHSGLHALIRFYSYGLLLIGFLVFLYFVVVVVVETATTGTPFGQRFQNVWVPVRLVLAIGLLVPINYGFNSGQYITLYAAKLGSSLATNGWIRYNNAIEAHALFGGDGNGANPTGEKHTLIAVPQQTEMAEVVEAMSLVHACAYAYWATIPEDGTPKPAFNSGQSYLNVSNNIKPYFVKSQPIAGGAGLGLIYRHPLSSGTTFLQGLEFFGNSDIVITFGEYEASNTEPGNVKPFCGEIRIPVTSIDRVSEWATVGGAPYMLNHYFNTVRDLWFGNSGTPLREGGIRFYEVTNNHGQNFSRETNSPPSYACQVGCSTAGLPSCSGSPEPCTTDLPQTEWNGDIVENIETATDVAIVNAWRMYVNNADLEIEDDILLRGWGGAGMWFNRLAELNGTLAEAVTSKPEIIKYPGIMEEVRKLKRQIEPGMTGTDLFKPSAQDSALPLSGGPQDITRAQALHAVYLHWNEEPTTDPDTNAVYNVFMDAMNAVLGVEGLLDIRGANAQTHPLSQLILIGKGLVESTLKNLTVATGSSFLGGIVTTAGSQTGGALISAIGGFYSQTAFIGLTAGIVLFYIIPFLPFVYFFFAVGTWVKSVFEAMVGVPLWALAHLRLDGEGLPGESASNGYFLILEIMIRPILVVFALVAALLIFTAQVRVLHFIWDLVVENTGAYNDDPLLTFGDPSYSNDKLTVRRGSIDQFFFTVIYAIIVYMLATASFKLIDNIPNSILRWSGAGVSAFGDQNQDALEGLQRYVAVAGMVQGQQLTQGFVGATGKIGGATGQALGLQGALRGARPGGV